MKRIMLFLLVIFVLLASACSSPGATAPASPSQPEPPPAETPAEPAASPEAVTEPEPTPMPAMAVTSAAIIAGEMGLPYGAKGEQFVNGYIPSLSLPLTVSYIPKDAAALVITMIDPDGGDWVHWLVVNIPVNDTSCEIPENASLDWPEEIIQGKNNFGTVGYGGPTPPSGVHNYVITVYALSETLELEAGFNLSEMQGLLAGKILAEASITGTYVS